MPQGTRIGLMVLLFLSVAVRIHGQTATYHLHQEASTIDTSFDKLLTAGPDHASVALTTALKNKAVGEYVIKEFETQTGVPNTAGVIPTGSTLSFSLWMRKTANVGTVFPRGKIRLNSATGTLFCTATGSTALTTTVTQQNFSCTTTANITMAASDRFYLWAGVNLTATSSTTFNGELDIEGTLNGNFDSQITVPLGTGAPTVSSLTPNTGAVGASIVIAGTNFRSTQLSGSTVTFNSTPATTITNWTTSSITATVPNGANSGNVVVTVGGQASNGVNFSVPPVISSLAPTSGEPGASLTISGSHFTATAGTVTLNGQTASTSGWSDASITATVPNGATSGNVVVTASGVQSNGVAFTVLAPAISSLNPTSGTGGTSVTISGSNFGTSTGTVTFAGQPATISTWSDSSIVALVPTTAATGLVVVSNRGLQSNGVNFTVAEQVFTGPVTYSYDELGRLVGVVAASGDSARYTYDAVGNILSITRYAASQTEVFTFSPKSGPVGTQVTISGSNFSANSAQDTVSFNGTGANITSASTTSLAATVPNGATTGTITVTSPTGSATSTDSFTVTSSSGAPSITSFTPQIAAASASVTISGANFDTSPQNDRVVVNTTPTSLPTSVTSSSMTVAVPALTGSGHISLDTPGGTATSSADLFIPPSGFTAAQVAYTGRTAFGTATTVLIGAANSIGLLLFDGKAGHSVSISVASPTFSNCWFQVYKPDNTALVSTALCSSPNSLASQKLPLTGTYAVLINASSGSAGSAVFTIYDSSDIVGTLTPGGPPFTVTTTVPSQNARLTFFGYATEHVSISLSNISFTYPNCTLTVYNPDNTSLVPAIACFNTVDFVEVPYLAERGTYTILISSSATQTGTITVKLNDATDINGGALTLGNPMSPTTTVPGQNASYTFTGTQNQHVSLSILSSTFNDCNIQIYNPNGTALVSGPPGGAYCDHFASFSDVPLLPQTGTYKLVVDPQGSNTGTVTFRLNDATDVTGTITTDGTPVTIATTVPGQKAKLTFSGTAGQNVSVLLDNNTYSELALTLVAPDGSNLVGVGSAGPAFLDTHTLPTTGTYTVLLSGVSGATGQARVRVFTVPGDATATGTLGGPQIPISIGTPGQNAKITFAGTQGGRIGIVFSGATFSAELNPAFSFNVFNPDGSQFAGPFNGGPFNFWVPTTSGFVEFNDVFTFPATGTYTVTLDPANDTTGSVNVTLYDATDLNLSINADGSVNNVTTTSPSQNAHLNFTPTIGQTVSAVVSNIIYPSQQPGLTLRRVDSGGNVTNQQFSSPDGSNVYMPPFTITQSGSYFLFFDPANQDVGSATVALYTVNNINTTVDTANDPVTVNLNTPGQTANVTFSANAGQNLTFSVNSTSFAQSRCNMTVKNPDGSFLTNTFPCLSNVWPLTAGAGQTGTYTIQIAPVQSATGNITVSVQAQ